MHSFKSHHFPANNSSFAVIQQYAMYYYGVFMLVVMIGVLVKVYVGQPILWFAILGAAGALLLGNAVAYVRLRRMYAEIFFLKEHFSLISVYEIVYHKEHEAFPLRYASPSRSEDQITFHFHDQIITLNKEDWDDFELIWSWLTEGSSQL